MTPSTPYVPPLASEQDALKQCPFCGGAPESDVTDTGRHVIECGVCPAKVNGSTEERAIAAWNRRTPSPGHASLSASDEREAGMLTTEQALESCPYIGSASRNVWLAGFCAAEDAYGIRLSSNGAASVLPIQGDAK